MSDHLHHKLGIYVYRLRGLYNDRLHLEQQVQRGNLAAIARLSDLREAIKTAEIDAALLEGRILEEAE